MASLSDLPDELLLQIFELGSLDQCDFRNACLVSKKFDRTASEFLYRSPSIGKRAYYPGHPVEVLATTLIQRPDLGCLTLSLTVQLTDFRERSKEAKAAKTHDQQLHTAEEFVSSQGLAESEEKQLLTSLRAGGLPDWLSIILAFTPKLHTLDLSGPSRHRLPDDFFLRESTNKLNGGAWLKSLCHLRIERLEPPNQWRVGANNIKTLERECSVHLLGGLGLRSSWEIGFWSSFPKLTTLRLNCFPLSPERFVPHDVTLRNTQFANLAQKIHPLANTLEVLEVLNPTKAHCSDWFKGTGPFLANKRHLSSGSDAIRRSSLKSFSSLKQLVLPQAALPFYIFDTDTSRLVGPRDVLPKSLEVLGLWNLNDDFLELLKKLNAEHDQFPNLREVRMNKEEALLQMHPMDRKPSRLKRFRKGRRFRVKELE